MFLPALLLALTSPYSVPAEEGNYRVTVTIGDPQAACVTTVRAETRRLMLENVRTAPGEIVRRSFAVNVRNSRLTPPPANAPGGAQVRLNEREKDVLHWDDRLTIAFTGCVTAIDVRKDDALPTIFLAGDSTVTDQPRDPSASWGQALPRFLNPLAAVANHAESGETLKSFLTGMRLDKLLSRMKRGDYLFIQFAHNDQKEQWPQTYVEAASTYRDYLKVYIGEARRRGATPVLVTSPHRRNFDAQGKIRNTLGDYPAAMRQVAKEMNVALIDLHAMSATLYEALGPANAPLAFAAGGRDATHHNNYGAYELAQCVVLGMRAAGPDLARLIATDVRPFDPARPDPPPPPTIFIAGDSTASNANGAGWGDALGGYFDAGRIMVANRARAGRSARTFLTEGLWDKLLNDVKPGDYVLLQLSHNDGGPLDTGRARGSLPGLGEETRDVKRPDGQAETVHTYGWYMRRFIADTQARGATPIVLSLTVRNIWNNGRIERGSGRYSEWAAELARAAQVPFVDVTNLLADRYERMGAAKVKTFFPADHTHTSAAGAEYVASVVLEGLNRLRDPRLLAARSAKALLAEPANEKLPTLFLTGDSTVRNGRGDGINGQWGWGELLIPKLDAARLNVVNRAVGGLSSRTFYTTGHWDRVLGLLKPGDFVVMQFGHNDGGPLDDPQRARGTLPGTGDETKEIDNPITKRRETVHTFGWYLRRFIAETRERGATPIVCSLVPRKIWKDGRIVRNADTYGGWAATVAAGEKTPFIDLNELVAREYDRLGPEKVDALFADPHTHTSASGAELNAALVRAALRAWLPGENQ